MFQVTEEGRQRVLAVEFRNDLEVFVVEAQRDFMDENVADTGVITIVACTLAGIDFKNLETLSEDELSDFERFMRANAEEINSVVESCQDFSIARDQKVRALRSEGAELWPTLKKKYGA